MKFQTRCTLSKRSAKVSISAGSKVNVDLPTSPSHVQRQTQLSRKGLCAAPGAPSSVGHVCFAAGILNLGLLVFLSLWQPGTDSLYPYFLVFGIWGFSDGIFLSQLNSIIPVVFPEKFEEAYTGMRVAQGLAVVVMMFSAQSMCMACKTYIVAGLCFFALLCYSILEIILRREKHTLKTLVTIVVEE